MFVTIPTNRDDQVVSAWFCMSPCRSDYIIPPVGGLERIVSEDFR